MPTGSEEVRLDRLEQWRTQLTAVLFGGDIVAYERSLEGRVSSVESALKGADSLAEAARELRRVEQHRWSRWQKVWLFVFAAITTACSVIAAVAVVIG